MSSRPHILITDTLFIQRKHELLLEEAGFQVVRLPKLCATEAELCEAITDKIGYILGGIEKVTAPVIAAAHELKAIVFTGVDYGPFIPALKEVQERGIAIGNTPGGPTQAVAEWAISAALLMNRHLLEFSQASGYDIVAPGLEGQRIGIIGYGAVGQQLARMLVPFRPESIHFYNRREIRVSLDLPGSAASLENLLATSDVVFLCISEPGNANWFDVEKIALMKKEALLVGIPHRGVVDEEALFEALKDKRIRAVLDQAVETRFQELPVSHWFCTNKSVAYCTQSEIDLVSTMAVKKMIELLK